MIYYLPFIIMLAVNCSSIPETLEVDAGTASGDVSEVSTDTSYEPDLPQFCQMDQHCPRGKKCLREDGYCYSATGCGGLWNEFAQSHTGCWYSHDEDLVNNYGYSGYIECGSDEECIDNPWGPYCIRNMCHPDPPCITDADCPGDWQCFDETICAHPSRLDGK